MAIEVGQLGSLLIRWSKQVKASAKRIHTVLGSMAVAHIRERTRRGYDVSGARFKPLAPITRQLLISRDRSGRGRRTRSGSSPLVDTGQMLRAVQFEANAERARVSMASPKDAMIGAVHQFGTTIVPRTASRLFLGWARRGRKRFPVFARQVRIPQRRWFGLTRDAVDEMEKAVREIIARSLG